MVSKGSDKRVPFRREREGRTDYRYRIDLLRSGKPRLIARISLRHIRAQVATPASEGDKIFASAYSKELSNFGWKGYTANTSAAYLVGLLCGYRAKQEGIGEGILDINRHVSSPEAKVFAVLKGALEAGLMVPHDEDVLPSDARCRGEHISNYAQELKSNEEEYQSQFASYLEKDIQPEDLPEHFKQVEEAIKEKYGE